MRHGVVLDEPETARLRARNQLTLPERVAARLGARAGDRFIVLVEGPDSVRLVRVRQSYAGALAGLWGASQAEADEWLREERRTWRRRQQLYDPDEPVRGG
jgi:bifunctional DNA-binding transcriptional regulator/antitoxin component of YhaV-PrlF toxin-antitoxin module